MRHLDLDALREKYRYRAYGETAERDVNALCDEIAALRLVVDAAKEYLAWHDRNLAREREAVRSPLAIALSKAPR